MDFYHLPKHYQDNQGFTDDMASWLTASAVPLQVAIARKLGIGPEIDDPNTVMFGISQSNIDGDLDATEKQLCTACTNLTPAALQNGDGYLHSASLEILLYSARTCALCNLFRWKIWDGIVSSRLHCTDSPVAPFTDEQLRDNLRILAVERRAMVLQPIPIGIFTDGTNSRGYQHPMLGTNATWCQIHPANGKASWKPGAFTLAKVLLHENREDTARPLLPRGDAATTLLHMREWLELREADLNAVSDRLLDTPLPTRVLDLGDAENAPLNHEADLRLIETNGAKGRYTTLSYSWGGYTDCRLLKANASDLYRHVAYHALPNVFQQAITVSRGLGIRYLWIDALCIVQDDNEDWKREAAQMADVYWYGACRLAITHCQNPTQDFFPPKDIVSSIRLPNMEREGDLFLEHDEIGRDMRQARDSRHNILLGGKHIDMVDRTIKDALKSKNIFKQVSSDNRKEHLQNNVISYTRDGELFTYLIDENDSGDHGELIAMRDDASNLFPEDDSKEDLFDSMAETMGEFSEKFKNAIQEAITEAEDNVTDETKVFRTFITHPKVYARDVDLGHLNSRGWVLQERLLAPRTIHFTENHMYFEDNHDICGEDWVRRHFTWMSCIDKRLVSSRSILFPEDGVGLPGSHHAGGNEPRVDQNSFLWDMFCRNSYRHMEDSSDAWLKIAESFSHCDFTYMTDRVMAIGGLVKRKQTTAKSRYEGSKNFLGLWERTLHIDLAWVVTKRARSAWPKELREELRKYEKYLYSEPKKFAYLPELRLPTWTWMAYLGPVTFTKDRRDHRKPYVLKTPPVSEIYLLHSDTPDMPDIIRPLPLEAEASLALVMTLREMSSVTADSRSYIQVPWNATRAARSFLFPYIHFDQRTESEPIRITDLSDCLPLYDAERTLIGFASFDQGPQPTSELFCGHLSTLRDDCTSFALQEASTTGVRRTAIPKPPVLAYALLLKRKLGTDNSFVRVGLAEIDHKWMTRGTKRTVRLV